jgi:hypothetical protein
MELKFYLWEIAGCIIQSGGKIQTPQSLNWQVEALRRQHNTRANPNRKYTGYSPLTQRERAYNVHSRYCPAYPDRQLHY